MNSILEVEPGLPPGLWLPTADESTDQYKHENFHRSNLTEEDLIDFGAFAVALALFTPAEIGRISFKPSRDDVLRLREAGYGPSERRFRRLGGITTIDIGLGFYGNEVLPTREEFRERLIWVVEYGYNATNPEVPLADLSLLDLLDWGSARNLLPSGKKALELCGGNLLDERKLVNMERMHTKYSVAPSSLFRLGARAMKEKGIPVDVNSLDKFNNDEFVSRPRTLVVKHFGNLTNFWLEFDRFYFPRSAKANDYKNVGVRLLVQNPDLRFTQPEISKLSAQKKFSSFPSVSSKFKGIENYRQIVRRHYQRYLDLRTDLENQGVSSDLTDVVGLRYDCRPAFGKRILSNVELLKKLSGDGDSSRWIRKLMKTGLDLLDEDLYELQLNDLLSGLKGNGIQTESDIRFVIDLIPRLDADEVIEIIRKRKQELTKPSEEQAA